MKKNLLILAVAGLALASCSNDETVAVNQSLADANVINFRALVSNMTRATDVTATTLQTSGFKVFSTVYNTETEGAQYFGTSEVAFTWNSTSNSYVSANKYYWPSSGSLNFYAWAASGSEQVTHTDNTKIFTVTPAALSNASSASGQTDLVFANTNNKSKTGTYGTSNEFKYGANGVPLNFRHTESKVILQIKNTNPNMKFTIGNVTIGNLYGSGTYTYSGGNTGVNTDGENTATLSGGWTSTGTQNATYSFAMSTTESYNIFNGTTAAKAVPNATAADNEMILIPQALLIKTTYEIEEGDNKDKFLGAYIKAQIKIQNAQTSAYIVGADTGEEQWVEAMWPLTALTWAPGYKYTYTVDLAGGGYYTTNKDDTDSALDPILEGAEIRFVSVTVDAWSDTAGIDVAGPTE